MSLRVGVDLLDLRSFVRIVESGSVLPALFTPAELAQCEGLHERRRLERLGGRYSAKEAVVKVLGSGFGQGIRWRDVEVLADDWGAPEVTLADRARTVLHRRGLAQVSVSITHQDDLVLAFALGS